MSYVKKYRYVNICIEQEAEDYHDIILQTMEHLVIKLYGGYYEPCSDRDAELANKLSDFIKQQRKNHETF